MARTEKRLDPFTAAYVEAMLWSTNDESDEGGGEPLDKNYGPGDIADETMELIVEDCADFQERYADLLSDSGIEDGRAGFCFWLSRGGHGSGFFDEDTIDEEFQEPLQEAAQSYGSFDLTVDEDADGDMVIYGPPPDWYRSHHHRGNVERLTGKPANPPAQESRRPPHRSRNALASRRAVWDLPTESVLWSDIPLGSHVKLVGHTYVVTLPNGTQASAYWSGRDARQAQQSLDRMVRAGERYPLARSNRAHAPQRRKR